MKGGRGGKEGGLTLAHSFREYSPLWQGHHSCRNSKLRNDEYCCLKPFLLFVHKSSGTQLLGWLCSHLGWVFLLQSNLENPSQT